MVGMLKQLETVYLPTLYCYWIVLVKHGERVIRMLKQLETVNQHCYEYFRKGITFDGFFGVEKI